MLVIACSMRKHVMPQDGQTCVLPSGMRLIHLPLAQATSEDVTLDTPGAAPALFAGSTVANEEQSASAGVTQHTVQVGAYARIVGYPLTPHISIQSFHFLGIACSHVLQYALQYVFFWGFQVYLRTQKFNH